MDQVDLQSDKIMLNDHKQTDLKKPLNAFQLYQRERTAHLMVDSPELDFISRNKVIGASWGKMTDEEKKVYFD